MRPSLLTAIIVLAGATSSLAQQPLEVELSADAIHARGDHFKATWLRDESWQLAQVQVEDLDGPFSICGARDDIEGLGALSITAQGETYSCRKGRAQAPRILEQTGDLLSFAVDTVPRSSDGAACPIRVEQVFTIFGEGAIFCEFTVSVPRDGQQVSIEGVEVGMALDTSALGFLRWHWKHTWRGKEDLPRKLPLADKRYLRVLGTTMGRRRPYTNQVEMCLEEQKSLAGDGEKGMWCEVTDDAGRAKRFSWHLGGPVEARPGYSYTNRYGIALGHFRTNDNAIGQRIAHWQEGNSNLMTYPSDSAIAAMAECGVTVCVLHLYWYNPAYVPYDEPRMRRWIESCHKRGIKCIVYAFPHDREGTAGINRDWLQRLGLDGIYFDFGATHARSMKTGAITGQEKRAFPAMGTVKLTRHFRQAVGPEGIIISHSGGYAPDAFFHLNLNAYLPGEAGVQGAMLQDYRAAAYHTGMSYAVVHPWCEYASFQNRHGAATYCAVGGFPHILFGRGTHQDNNYHRSVYHSARFVLPYWQMLSLIPMDRQTTLYTASTAEAAVAQPASVRCCVYQRSTDLLLVTASNLGDTGETSVRLDEKLLGLSGEYRALEVAGKDIGSLSVTDRGRWAGGPIDLGALDADDHVGLLLFKGQMPEHTSTQLARIRRLVAAFNDTEPPSVPRGLTARADRGVVRLAWAPAADEHHVSEYKLYRGQAGAVAQLLATAEEATEYADRTASLGADIVYAVSAVDASGNESPRSDTARLTTPGSAIAYNRLTAVNGQWSESGVWLLQGAARKPAPSDGVTVSFPARKAQYIRAYFTGGMGNYGCAHVVELQARGAQGEVFTPAAVTSSGDDAGHPASDVADGVTNKTGNGWWSDRNKPLPAWVALDLGGPRQVAGVWLLTFWDGTRFYDYTIEVSDDGQEWTPVTGTGATAGPVANARSLAPVELADGIAGVTTLELDPERSGGGLLFRCLDGNNGYSLTLEPRWDGNLVLDKLVEGKLKRLKGAFFPFSIHNPIPHRIWVECRGSTIKCYCDGALAFEVQDDTFGKGKVGLIVPSGRRLKYRNLSVSPLSVD